MKLKFSIFASIFLLASTANSSISQSLDQKFRTQQNAESQKNIFCQKKYKESNELFLKGGVSGFTNNGPAYIDDQGRLYEFQTVLGSDVPEKLDPNFKCWMEATEYCGNPKGDIVGREVSFFAGGRNRKCLIQKVGITDTEETGLYMYSEVNGKVDGRFIALPLCYFNPTMSHTYHEDRRSC